ncbi:MAG: protein phosphatase 2C domain-containing protein [Betaproteobacteria bacterium]
MSLRADEPPIAAERGSDRPWILGKACVPGALHRAQGVGCEDVADMTVVETRDGPALVAYLSDGAGGAGLGGVGARVAVNSAMAFMRRSLIYQPMSVGLAYACAEEVRNHLVQAAVWQGAALLHLSCTWLGAVVTHRSVFVMQIGDGAIVVGENGRLRVPIQPMRGVSTATTAFIGDREALMRLVVKDLGFVPDCLALLSDGLQDYALEPATGYPRLDFLVPLFTMLEQVPDSSDHGRDAVLNALLRRPELDRPGSDDRSLLLACNALC